MNATDILKGKGLKKSAQRVAVINILQKSMTPMTEDEIKTEMGEMYDRVTFYRTMQALCSAEIVHRIVIDNTTLEYALNTAEKGNRSHVHFFCISCHSAICLKDVPVYTYNLPANYQQKDCEVLIKGICPACAKKEQK